METLVHLLARRALATPDKRAYTFLADGEVEEGWLTYAGLDRRARALGGLLARRGIAGERALLLYPPGLDFITAFFGCLYAGAIAVPAYPPASSKSLPRLAAILRDARPAAVLTASSRLGKLERAAPGLPGLADIPWLATDETGEESAGAWEPTVPALESPAFLQYTSGSTADPKGVVVSHGNLLHNEEMIRRAFRQSEESVVVGWLPLYHDMGLIGNVLQTLYAGSRCVLMSPMAFLTRPLRWLEAISRYGGTTSGGPNFAYELCARKATADDLAGLDLGRWEVAFNGAEPVRAATLRRFAEVFAPCGFRPEAFYPCYGLAEATLFVSGGATGGPSRVVSSSPAHLEQGRFVAAAAGEPGRELVSCGTAWLGQEIAVVDPETSTRCAADRVGEIWLAGPSVAWGYWRAPEATERDFGGRLADDPAAGPFLRTGDLGLLLDGELFVTGRLKDLLIVRGRNHYPQDLELTAEKAHPALRPGAAAAFAVDVDGKEEVVIVSEAERRAADGIGEIAAAVRQALAQEHEIGLHDLVLLPANALPKTSSGKIQRRACRDAYLTGGLPEIARSGRAPAPAAAGGPRLSRGALLALEPPERLPALLSFLLAEAARAARVPVSGIAPEEPLIRIGLDSLAAIELQRAVEEALGVPVPVSSLLEGADAAGLAEDLLGRLESAPALRHEAGPSRPDTGVQPVSIGQRSLWFVERLAPDSAVFNLAGAAEVRGPLDPEVLRRDLERLAERHSMLRTTFSDRGGELRREVHPRPPGPLLREEDARGLGDAEVDALLAREAYARFDLEREPPLRVVLFRRGGEPDLLLFVIHHLAADFWSLAVLLRDLGRLHGEATGRGPADLPPPAASYGDFVAWQERELAGPEGERAMAYWRDQLAGEMPQLALPTDRPRPPARTYRGGDLALRVDGEVAAAFRRQAQRGGASLFTALLAAFGALLGRYSGQCEILIGAPAAGRTRPELLDLVGYCVNPIVLRADLTGAPGFRELLPRVRDRVLGALEHQGFPFSLLVERLQPERDPSRPPLFQVAFALQRSHLEELPELSAWALGRAGDRLDLGGLVLASRPLPERRVEFDLMLVAAEVDGGLGFSLQYNSVLFDRATVERMAGHLLRLLAELAARPGESVAELPLLSAAEEAEVLVAWNRTETPRGAMPLHRRFEAQVRSTPGAVALRGEEGVLRYGELNARANQVARHLAALGVGPGARVGLCLERGLDLMVGLLGALKAGAAYVPLDVDYPRERLAFMLADAGVRAVLTQERWAARADALGVPVVRLDADRPTIETRSAADPERDADVDQLLYVIYTSGSTGRPKGAGVYQRGFLNLLDWFLEEFGIGPDDRSLLVSSFSFDLTQKNLYATLLAGGELHLNPPGVFDAAETAARIREPGATLVNCTPSAFYAIADSLLAGGPGDPLRLVFLGGEPISVERLGRWLHPGSGRAAIVNTYGPTECTDIAASYRLGTAESLAGRPVPVGRAIPNARVYVLGRALVPCPVGVPGEICIGGAGVGIGYLNDAAQTASRFMPDPFDPTPGARLYRTGDLARWLPDGELEFHGRMDEQVKVRGFRIELGEIESALRQHPGVEEAAVLLREAPAGGRLVAYLVPDRESARPVRELARLARLGETAGAGPCELPNGMTVFHQNRSETDFLYQELFVEESYLRHGVTLEDGACVFDVGANIGLFDLYLARRWRDLRILAFEPLPPILEVLRRNLALYGAPVEVHAHGLASAPGTAVFDFYPHVSILSGRFADAGDEHDTVRKYLLAQLAPGGQVEEAVLEELLAERLERQSFECALKTLSEVIRETGVERIDLLKVDVEKAELDVLLGVAEEDWPKIRQVVAEVHDLDGRLERITGLLHRHGFEVVVEQEEALRENDIFNLFARRPGLAWAAPSHPGPAPAWASRDRLLDGVRRSLAERLPEYMIPASFVVLDELPQTPNGKLDRRALPEPEAERPEERPARPLGPVEEILAGLWGDVLGVAPPASPDESFFALGGHSLLATQLVSRIRDTFAIELPVRRLFESPTLGLLAAVIEEERAAGAGRLRPLLARRADGGTAPLSFAQERLWFLQQLEPDDVSYNMAASLRMRGLLDVPAFAAALNGIVRRHQVLRAAFSAAGGTGVQTSAPGLEVLLPRIDLGGLERDRAEKEALALARREARRPFDLGRPPLLRARLVRLDEREHLLLFVMHHIVSDGWSVGVLVRELSALYAAFASGRPSPLPELPVQYADFALWQRQWFSGAERERQLDYWRGALAGLAPELALPYDHPRTGAGTGRGAEVSHLLPASLAAAVQARSRRSGTTLFITLLAALQAVLHRYTGEVDVAVGTPIANRNQGETEGLIGFFVNTLVLRGDLAGDPRFGELLAGTRRVALAAFDHQDTPFEAVVEAVNPQRQVGHTPLFQVLLVLQNTPQSELRLPGLTLALERLPSENAIFDLSLVVEETREGGLRLDLEYATDLFEAPTVLRLAHHFAALLEGAVAAPELRLSELPLQPAWERHQVLREWNDTRGRESHGETLHGLFERQAARRGEAEAVVCGEQSLTYAELEERSNRLARYLRRRGVGRGIRVGLCVERSLEMAVGVLGVLKAGASYVPLDPSYPPERLEFMVADSLEGEHGPVMLSLERLAGRLPGFSGERLLLDRDWEAIAGESAEPPEWEVDEEDLAVLIYTSGSTGRPKGVMIPHRALVNYCLGFSRRVGLTHADRVMQFAALSFDTASEEIYPTWTVGATLVLRPQELFASIADFERFLVHHRITFVDLPSSYWHEWTADLAQSGGRPLPPAVRLVGVGSEITLTEKLRTWHELFDSQVIVFNGYGPTEVTVAPVVWMPDLSQPVRGPHIMLVGRPVENYRVHLLDRGLRPVPLGVAGEVLLGGRGVTQGYLGRPELTAERFVPDPFPPPDRPGERLYRTGDLARYLGDGVLEYVGRVDEQIKIRGFRIEPGEIEAALLEHPAIEAAVVVAREAPSGGPRLVAYFVAAGPPPAGDELRALLRRSLPEHMVPAVYVCLEAMPLNPNGKLDRRALPAPEEIAGEKQGATGLRGPVEELLAQVWSGILGVPRVGSEDNFFELGGHSLLGMQVVSRVREALGVELAVRTLFEAPTLRELAERIEALQGGARPPEPPIRPLPREGAFPLSFAQQRLWFLDQLQPGSAAYNIAAALRLEGDLSPADLEAAFQEVARRHETLRTRFVEADREPAQRIAADAGLALPRVDLGSLPPERQEAEAERLAGEEARLPFDLSLGPLLRLALLRLGPRRHVLLLTLHHIVGDGWSMGILMREVAELYAARLAGRSPLLPALPVQYADYAVWQREWLSGEVLEAELAWWQERLAGSEFVLELPTDRPRPRMPSRRGGMLEAVFTPELSGAVAGLCRGQGVTPYMALLAAFEVLLHRHSGRSDLVLGTGVANRGRVEVEGLIGFFVNTLVLRTDLGGDPTFGELLGRVREVTLGAFAHQDLPFEKLVERLAPERDPSRSPLFQVMFALQNAPMPELEMAGLRLVPRPVGTGTAKFDLALFLSEEQEGLKALAEYDADLFDEATVRRWLGHLEMLLGAAAAEAGRRIAELPLLTGSERTELLGWQSPRIHLDGPVPLHRWFEERAALAPDATAVVCDEERLSYGELNARANRLAHHLIALGAGPEVPVGLCLERSLDLVVAILAILKSGGAYLPLDPAYPRERLAFMMADCRARLVVTEERLAPTVSAAGVTAVCLDSLMTESAENPRTAVEADNLCYVIYTSGSTGRPKGSLLTHANVWRLLRATEPWFGFDEKDVWTLFHSYAFDFSVWELWGALLYGGRLVVVPYWVSRSPEEFHRLLAREGVTVLNQTPSAFRQLIRVDGEAGSPELALRWVIFGGEALEPASLAPWYESHDDEHPLLVNMYGITETTVHVTWRPLTQADLSAPHGSPIGVAIPDLALRLLDPEGELVPAGVPGELHVGGPGLARGYLNRPDLTAERFVPDPWSSEPGARLYRAGDLARYLPDGSLDFLGRRDDQVKIRGFRIELGEIEAAIRRHPAVEEAAVAVREYGPEDRRLVAYVVPHAERALPLRTLARLEREGKVNGHPRYELPNGMTVFHQNRSETDFLYRELFEDQGYLRHGVSLADGACVFDVGANIGLFDLYLARRFQGLKIYAFEPLPPIFEVLRLNAELYGLDAELLACGLASAPGEARFEYFPHASVLSGRFSDGSAERETVRQFLFQEQAGAGGQALTGAEIDELLEARLEHRSFSCPLKTVSEVMREHGIERIDLLKVDVEQAELDVLLGIAEEDWPKIRQAVIEVHDLDGRLETIRSLLSRHGFTVVCEQPEAVAGTNLYELYAVRPETATPHGGNGTPSGSEPRWSSRARLESELRAHLQSQLPDYMIPPAFVWLDALPLTPSGKVDRRALPSPQAGEAKRTAIAPRNPTEAAVAEIWGEVLGISAVGDVGVEDNFFEAGGHSLLATQLLSRLRQRFGVNLDLRTLFAEPTVAHLARRLEGAAPVPGSSGGKGPLLRTVRRGNRSLDELK